MGLGMQIVYVGFPGSSAIEAQAGVQLLRLGRFNSVLSECRLVVELLPLHEKLPRYGVRLDLASSGQELDCASRCESADLEAAMRAVFDVAERKLSLNQNSSSSPTRRWRTA